MENVNNVVEFKAGDTVRYRATKGRGRPAVGVIQSMGGLFVRIKNSVSGDIACVKADRIIAQHEFKPYNMKHDADGYPLGRDGQRRTRRTKAQMAALAAVTEVSGADVVTVEEPVVEQTETVVTEERELEAA